MNSVTAISPAEALRAVRNRDASYDGRLFYAVLTTGIFCKPSCTSRQANSENLRFYDSAAAARQAGFRACKRCAPESADSSTEKLIQLARYIEAHSDEKLPLAKLAQHCDLSPSHLQKAFKARIGLSPKAFQDGIRQQRFKSLLREGESVTDAVFAAGYGSASRVYEKAAEKLGMTPGSYRAGAVGEQLSYTCAETQFGFLLLAATDKGVCFAMFGEHEAALYRLLQDEFPGAYLERSAGDAELDQWFLEIEQYLSAYKVLPNIPIDLRGTAFQLRVWDFLRSIPAGDVLSYSDVANGINQPKAVRAAASACAKNRIALLVPCHRVLRGDGGMGGYRWGVDTKKALLKMEQQSRLQPRD